MKSGVVYFLRSVISSRSDIMLDELATCMSVRDDCLQ